MKAFLTFAACLTLMGCATSIYHDTINVSGTPIKLSLRQIGAVVNTAFEVSINDKVVGTAQRKSLAPGMQHSFETIQTPYGKLRLERKIEITLANSKNYFEVYLNEKFAGLVMADVFN